VERDLGPDRSGEAVVWRDLVARLEFPVPIDPDGAPWPDSENLHPQDPAAGPAEDAGQEREDQADDAGDRYIPPPASLPVVDPVIRGAWIALFGGPGYLFVATLLNWQVSGWAEIAAIAAFVIGFLFLVFRLGGGPSRKDDPDQGAVVLPVAR
jgi:hypothetical protein